MDNVKQHVLYGALGNGKAIHINTLSDKQKVMLQRLLEYQKEPYTFDFIELLVLKFHDIGSRLQSALEKYNGE